MNHIQVKNIAVGYDNIQIIQDISVQFHEGEITAIIGPNGCGKSTLLKLIVGLCPFEDGEYFFEGDKIDADFLNDNQKVGNFYRHFGFVFQNPDIQLFNMTVYDEVAFGLRNLDLSEDEVKQRVMDSLELLGINHLKERVPYHLSGGEKKLVAIASVLVMNPDVIIFDEPFNGLSPKYRKLITELIQRLQTIGKTFIISSHHFTQIRYLVDKAYIFTEDHTLDKEVLLKDLEDLPDFIEYLDNI